MTPTLTAYMPLATYPEAALDEGIRTTLDFAAAIGVDLQVTVFTTDIPQAVSPFGNLMIDVKGLVRAAEEKSRSEAARLQDLVNAAAGDRLTVRIKTREVVLGGMLDVAATEARLCDLALMVWTRNTVAGQDLTQSIVFGSGRPTIVVPPTARPTALDHIAIAWDGSRVAARALGDALPLLAKGGRISVLTVTDEKPLGDDNLAEGLAEALQGRGYNAVAVRIALGDRKIAEALQDTAVQEGAGLLAMGGFGHSRLRDFILGGATLGVLAQLSVPVLLSH